MLAVLLLLLLQTPDSILTQIGFDQKLGERIDASISFRVVDAFTRMLIGNERNDGSDFQATHSNFNYSKHETDHVEVSDQKAYMVILPLPGIERTVVRHVGGGDWGQRGRDQQ